MTIVVIALFVTIYAIFAVKICMTLTSRMGNGLSKVKCKYESQCRTFYLMQLWCVGNSNVCLTCHHLQINPITHMLSIRIIDIKKVCQVYELQCQRINPWMAFLWPKNGEKWRIFLKSLSCGSLTRHIYTHTDTHFNDYNRRECKALQFA